MRQMNKSGSNLQPPADGSHRAGDLTHFSPSQFLVVTIGGIFLAEVVAMRVLLNFRTWPYSLQTLLDASIMVLMIFPLMYYFSLRPLLSQIKKRQQAEEALKAAYDEMELHVQRRTEELKVANSDLEEEIRVRAQVEEALRQSEQRLSRAQEIAHLGSWELDLLTDQLTWSDEVYRIFGLPPQKFGVTYEAFLEATHPDDRAMVDDAYSGSIRNGLDKYEIEHRVVKHSSGEVRIVHEKCEHFRDENGQIVRSVGMVHDITERKHAEEALQKSEAMLRAVLNQMPSGVTVRDAATGELILSNARSREILGELVETTDQLSEYHGLHFDGTYYQNEEWPVFRSIATGEKVDAEEIDFERSSGRRATLSVSSAPIHDAQGQIISGVAVFHDITERKKAEGELKQLNRTLQAHNASSKAMLRATKETELLNEVCKIIVEVCGHAMVWIGYAEDNQEKSVRPVANAGFEEGYLDTLQITWADTERGRGPTGTAIRTGRPSICRNMLTDPQFAPWREQARQRGYASSIVLPLISSQRVFGGMTIYSRQPEAFSPDEEILLSDLASDLAHGIEMIRLREANESIATALRQSEERFRLALTHAPVTVAVQDLNLRYTWAYNQRRRPVDEMIGKTDADLFPSEAKQLTALKRRVIDTGENASEQMWINSDDRRLFLDLFVEPLKNDQGEIEGVGLATVDLTAIKQAEEALRESETKYRNLFENMTEEVHFWKLVYDEAGRIKTWQLVDANPPSLKSWDRKTIEEIKGKTTDEIFGLGATEHFMPVVQKIMTERSPYSYEDYFDHLGKHFRFTSVPLQDHFITTGADITSLKRAEEVLRTARDQLEIRVRERTEELAAANQELVKEVAERERVEQQLRIQTTAMEAAANGMVITDSHGTIEWTNPALTQISGYEPHEMIGQGMRLFQSGRHDKDFYKQLWGTIQSGNVWHGETTNRRKDGSLYIEEQTITPVRNENSQISHFIAIKQDVTERKLMYAQLEESNRELTSISISERQQRKVAEILSEASVALSQTLDIQQVMETILDYVEQMLPVDAAILILSEGEEQYRVRGVRSSDAQRQVMNLLNQTIDLLNEPVVKPFFAKETSTLIRDSQELDVWNPPVELADMRSWLGIPLISTGKTLGMVVAANVQSDFFTGDQVELAEAVVSQATVALQNAWLFEQVRAGRQRLQMLSRHLVEIQENERKFIARELHDETSQALTSLKLGLHSIEQFTDSESTIGRQIASLKTLADEILESLHRLAMNLRPASLDHLGLVEALTSLVQSTGERTQLTTRFKCLGVEHRNRLTEDLESSVYRIVQESLTNIVRHAKATVADVILEWRDDHLMIIVEDDGIGMDLTSARASGRLGLVGMQERAEMLGGTLLIESNPNAGTTLVVEIPYAH